MSDQCLSYAFRCLAHRYCLGYFILKLSRYAMQAVNLPRGFAYVEFKEREEAEKARAHMDGGQLDGNVLRYNQHALNIVL